MAMTWWGVQIYCPDCKAQAVLQTVCFAADGEWKFIGYCFDCKSVITWKAYASYFRWQASEYDAEKAREAKKKQLKPGPIIPPLAEDHKKDDDDFLHGMGIDPVQ